MTPTPAEQTLESAWARRWVEWWERYDDLVAERNRLVAIGADPDSLLVPDAPPAEPTLDVERLARALENLPPIDIKRDQTLDADDFASMLAREYIRLATEDKP